MGAPLPIRDALPATQLRRLARQESNGRVACRVLALANVRDGMRREDAAGRAGMDRQTLRDWVIRFNAEGIEGLRRGSFRRWLARSSRRGLSPEVHRGPAARREEARLL